MNAVINFVELENQVVSATYRNLMVRAKVVVVNKTSGEQLPDPVVTIASPAPAGRPEVTTPGGGETGNLFLQSAQRPRRICREKRRVRGRLTSRFARFLGLCLPYWRIGNCYLP